MNQVTHFLWVATFFWPPAVRLIDHQSLDLSQSPIRSFVVSTGSSLSVRNHLHFEHLDVAVSELEHDDTLDLGQVKL